MGGALVTADDTSNGLQHNPSDSSRAESLRRNGAAATGPVDRRKVAAGIGANPVCAQLHFNGPCDAEYLADDRVALWEGAELRYRGREVKFDILGGVPHHLQQVE